MKRLQRDAVLVSLIEHLREAGSWCGETHVQKSTYFLQDLLTVPLGFEFILYKHGPFSFDLSSELVLMRADGILRLVPQSPYGPTLVPDRTVEVLKRNYPKTIGRYSSHVGFVANHLGRKNVAELERLGTALYISLEAGGGSGARARAKRMVQLKPHVPLDKAIDATSEFDTIKASARQVTGMG